MNAFFRHMSIRLWGTAIAAGLLSMLLLPYWQRIMGLNWLLLPVAVLITGCYAAIGWLMSRLGLALIKRQVTEAGVWERAGMGPEAETAFERAKAIFDSFWLSPSERRRSAEWVTSRLARYYLAMPELEEEGQAMVKAYLQLNPRDEAIALGWLEDAMGRESRLAADHDLLARIGQSQTASEKVQRALMQLYLADRRIDFEALQTYRRLWQRAEAWPSASIRALAHLLLSESFISDWALQVYLKGYATGDPYCLEGIAAGVEWLRPHAGNRKALAAAGEILASLDGAQRQKLHRAFKPVAVEEPAARDVAAAPPEVLRAERSAFQRPLIQSGARMVTVISRSARMVLWRAATASARVLFETAGGWRRHLKIRHGATVVVLVGTFSVLVVYGWFYLKSDSKPAAPPARTIDSAAPPAPAMEPYTIQVAAYLKSGDAQQFVDQLKGQKIDAFWTQAQSAHRTWYQVKVSHFSTREEARQYGEALKAKGLIDDFYVANYSP